MSAAPIAEIDALLANAEVAYMIVGSIASTYHGPPRTTQDVDVVVELDDRSVSRLLESVDRGRYYVPDALAHAAVARGGQFNLVDLRTGWKIDLIVRRDRPFSREEFARRQRVVVEGVEAFMATAEDTVLSKLEWARMSESDRQVGDAASVLAVAGDQIDDTYLDRWAETLGIAKLLSAARSRARSG